MQLLAFGGPPTDWDIKRYADSMSIKLVAANQCPPTMVPFGRTNEGVEMKGHSACFRLMRGVIKLAQEDKDRPAAFQRDHPTERYTRQAAAAGVPEPTPQDAPLYGQTVRRVKADAAQKAAAEAAEAEASGGPTLGDLRLGRGSITLINEREAVRAKAQAQQLAKQPRQPATGMPATESTGAAAASSAKRREGAAPSKYAPLGKLAKPSLLLAARQRADDLNEALAKLDRQTAQYQQQLGLKRESNAISQALLRERGQLARLLKMSTKEVLAAHERLQPFDEAAAKLKEAGMRDIPHLYATGVTTGRIHPQCFFNSYMNDAVRNVHQATHYTCVQCASNPE